MGKTPKFFSALIILISEIKMIVEWHMVENYISCSCFNQKLVNLYKGHLVTDVNRNFISKLAKTKPKH